MGPLLVCAEYFSLTDPATPTQAPVALTVQPCILAVSEWACCQQYCQHNFQSTLLKTCAISAANLCHFGSSCSPYVLSVPALLTHAWCLQYCEHKANTNFAEEFNKSMTYFTQHSLEGGQHSLRSAFDWSRTQVVMDVGGGQGELLSRAMLYAGNQCRGVLLDRPHVLDRQVLCAALRLMAPLLSSWLSTCTCMPGQCAGWPWLQPDSTARLFGPALAWLGDRASQTPSCSGPAAWMCRAPLRPRE